MEAIVPLAASRNVVHSWERTILLLRFSAGIRGSRGEGRGRRFGRVAGGEAGADREGAAGGEPAAAGVGGQVVQQLQGVHQGGAPVHARAAGRRNALNR